MFAADPPYDKLEVLSLLDYAPGDYLTKMLLWLSEHAMQSQLFPNTNHHHKSQSPKNIQHKLNLMRGDRDNVTIINNNIFI
jgi:hypothetical protein